MLPGNQHLNGQWIEGYLSAPNYINPPESAGEFLVDENTVCQYTGLTDRNSRKIFEGDIVKFHDRNNDYSWMAVIVFGNPNSTYNWGWQLMPIGDCEGNPDILLWVDMEESGVFCEIAGNIFDNSELMNQAGNGETK